MSKRLFNGITKDLAVMKLENAKARFESDLLSYFDVQQKCEILTSSLFLETRALVE
jgi:hypothetical protein